MNKVLKTILSAMVAITVLSSCNQGSSNKGTKQESLKALEAEKLKYLVGTWSTDYSSGTTQSQNNQQYLDYDDMTYQFFTIGTDASVRLDSQHTLSMTDSDKNQHAESYFDKSNNLFGKLGSNSAGEIIIQISQEMIDEALADGMPWEEIQTALANPIKIKINDQGKVYMVYTNPDQQVAPFEIPMNKIDANEAAVQKAKAHQYADILDAKIKQTMGLLKGKTFKMVEKLNLSITDGKVDSEHKTSAADIQEEVTNEGGHVTTNAKLITFESMLKAKANNKHAQVVSYTLGKDLKSIRIVTYNKKDENTYYSSASGFFEIIDANNFNLVDSYLTQSNGKNYEYRTITKYTIQ